MHKTINGYTKESMIDKIMKGNIGKKALDEKGQCKYLTEDGNKCAVGCFIPDGHKSQAPNNYTVGKLLSVFEDLKKYMPLETEALGVLQRIHDGLSEEEDSNPDPRPLLIEWINENVA